MKINLYNNLDNPNSHIIKFFMSLKKFNFIFDKKQNYIKKINEQNIFIFNDHFDTEVIKNNVDILKSSENARSIFLIPKNQKKKFDSFKINILEYPINISELEQKILSFYKNNKIVFKDLELINDNTLLNNKNNQSVFLTEIESRIIKMLFLKIELSKETINDSALDLHPSVDSKTLESHLYRIRKKITSINSQIQINSLGNKSIKIQ